ncbi:unnamed protein product [marine sediment metagenome]|uniref:Uncharacterized protein n=1 Tax=marine sediment metagenome TaxID=412755 RepID=X1KW47_9ZZZZ
MKKIVISLSDIAVASPGVPVYLISTVSKSGIRNIAPYGMVMPASHNPPAIRAASKACL